jgi:hypothetical protein
MHGTHQLLEVQLNGAGDLVACRTGVDLTNMIQSCVRLIAIHWAQLQKESVANGG